MSSNPQSGGRSRGGITPAARQQTPMVPISLAKQEKSQEVRLYNRFKELDPEAVRVTLFRGGSRLEEIFLLDPITGQSQWIDAVKAEGLLATRQADNALKRAIMRAPVRLGEIILTDQAFQALPEEKKRILLMTQKEYNLFRDLQKEGKGQQAPAAAGSQTPTAIAAGPQNPAARTDSARAGSV